MDDVRLEARGLWTDPNELTTPQGALLEALNVRIKRVNVIEPRPGFVAETIEGPSDPAWNALPWMRSLYVATGDGLWRIRDADGDPDDGEVLAGGASLVLSQDTARGAPMGRNYYVVTDEGIYRIPEPGSLAATLAGIPQALLSLWELVATGALDDDKAMSVRVLFADTVNEQLLLGAPSDPLRIQNTSGSSKGISLQVPLPDGVTAGMRVQVYRTLPVDVADPTGDEMFLGQDVAVTSSDVTAGFAVVDIMTPGATSLGASLYTNETQEGILQANTVPPRAKCIAWFHQMAFYGDVANTSDNIITGTSNPFNSVQVGASNFLPITTTNGSAVATWDQPLAGNNVGVYVSQTQRVATIGSAIPAFTRIIAVTPTTITMSAPATASGSMNVYFLSVLTVDGEEFINGFSDTANRQFGTWQDLVAIVSRYTSVTMEVSDLDAAIKQVVLRADHPFSVFFTSLNPVLTLENLWNETPADSTVEDPSPARLMWSKLDQPEAVPALNFVNIGDYRQPIMALAPTRDSLFVLKADGVWRVTGDTPETLRVEAYDSTLHLLHRRACDTHENAVWAWTTQGVVSITEAGTERVGSPIANMVASQAEGIRDSPFAIGGIFIASCTQQRCVLVGIQESNEADSPAGFVCVYENESGAWARWETAGYPWRGAAEYSGQIVIVGGDESADVGTQGVTRDRLEDVEVTALSGALTYTITGLDGADAVGALVDRGDSAAWVTEHVSGNIYRATAALTLGDAQASYPVPVNIQWAAAPTSGSYVHWRQMRAQMSYMQNTYRVDFGFVSERAPTESTVYVEYSEPDNGRGVTPIRMMVSRAQSRCARLRPSMRVGSALQTWALEGLTLTGEPMRGSEKMP